MNTVKRLIRRTLHTIADSLRARVRRKRQQYFIETGETRSLTFWELSMLALARDIYDALGIEWVDDEGSKDFFTLLNQIGG